MTIISGQVLDQERALYGLRDAKVRRCLFEGPADGESALKECGGLTIENCDFLLRYPLWHVDHSTLRNCRMAETCRGPRRSYWLHRARALEKKITWRCPNVAEYREQLAILDEKLHISSKLNLKNVSTVAAGNLLWFASELWYNYLNLPADFTYWLLAAPGMILTILGLHRIFEPAILAKYQKKMRKKRREDRMGYLSAVCDELASLLLWASLFAVLRVLLLEWIS